MAALIASISNANFSGRELVGETEKSAIGAGVGAETFLPQKVNGHKAADEKERDGD
jgi:hypothetical protein